MKNNEKAIATFFEGYGSQTVTEYGKTFFDVLHILQQGNEATGNFLQDVTAKFLSVYTLLTEINPGITTQEQNLN
jgi:hypothetical protein